MLQWMEAEVLFLNPNDVSHGIAVLERNDFRTEILDWIDPYGPTVWIKARTSTELDDNAFLDWVASLVGPEGDVVEAGLTHGDASGGRVPRLVEKQ
jgi:hypothetical protein